MALKSTLVYEPLGDPSAQCGLGKATDRLKPRTPTWQATPGLVAGQIGCGVNGVIGRALDVGCVEAGAGGCGVEVVANSHSRKSLPVAAFPGHVFTLLPSPHRPCRGAGDGVVIDGHCSTRQRRWSDGGFC